MGRRIALAAGIVGLIALLLWLALRKNDAAPPAPPESPAQSAAPAPRAGSTTPPARARRAEAPALADAAALAPPAALQGPTIAGRVIDADGGPVAGARIVSHPDDLAKAVDGAQAGGDGTRSFIGMSAADGRFEIRCDPATIQSVLTATADAGFGQSAARPGDRDVELRLAKWTLLEGRVTDTAGAPIAGAQVTAHLLLEALTEDRTAVSGEDGTYRIERLPTVGWSPSAASVGRGRHAWVVAEAEGFAPLLVEREAMGGPRAADPTKLDLVLVRGMTLSGRVVDGDTKAGVEGATVVCWSVEGMMSYGSPNGTSIRNPWGPRPLAETRSAADGTFRFEHLPAKGPGGVASHNSGKRGMTLGHVAAWAPGYVHGGDEIPVSKDGASVETTIELWPSATITGRVVDPAGKAIEGASVMSLVKDRITGLNGFPDFYAESKVLWVKSAADGTYAVTTFRASRAGPTTGTVRAGLRVAGAWTWSPRLEVTAKAGETVAAPDLVVDVSTLLRAMLVVTDVAGTPIPGAVFEAELATGLRTGQDGRLLWANDRGPNARAPVKPQTFVVRARGFAAQKVTFTPATGEPVEVKIVLRSDSRVAGLVLRADGTPAARAMVYVLDPARTVEEVLGDGSASPGIGRVGVPQFAIFAMSTVADDGRFSVEGLPEGPYYVVAQIASRAPSGTGRSPRYLRAVRSGVAAGTEDVTLTIPADDAPPTQALDVVVTDAGGTAIPGCTAQAISESLRLWAEPAGAGKVRFAALTAGKWSVQVSAQGWSRTIVPDVLIDAATPPPALTIRLDRGITLRGAVRAESGALPDGVQVWLSPIEQAAFDGSIVAADIGKDGAYTLSGLVAGRHRVTVCTAGGFGTPVFVAPGNAVVTLEEGARDATADLVVVRGGTVSVSVRDPRLPAAPFTGGGGSDGGSDADKDRFAAASRIEVLDASGALVFTQSPIYTNFGGSAWLAPGDYTVRLRLSGEAPQDQRVTVKAGETVSARFKSN